MPWLVVVSGSISLKVWSLRSRNGRILLLSKPVLHHLARYMKSWEKCLHVCMLHIPCSIFCINSVAVARCSQWQHQLERLISQVTQWQNIAFKQACATSFGTVYEELGKCLHVCMLHIPCS